MTAIVTANRPGAVARYVVGVVVATAAASALFLALWARGYGYAAAGVVPVGAAVFVWAVHLTTQRASAEAFAPQAARS